VLTVVRR